MAEKSTVKEALDKLNAKLECAVCLTSYTDPKLLPCFHVFCKKCLERMMVQHHDGLSLQCPVCRQHIPLPPNGVSALQSDFHVNHLFEIRDAFEKASKSKCENCEDENASGFCRDCGNFLCDSCKEMHQKWKQFKSHEVISLEEVQREATNLVRPKKQVSYCPKHPGKKLKIYCETCSELICNDCTIDDHPRPDHKYNLIANCFQKHKDEIESSLQPLEQQLSTVNKALHAFEVTAKEIQDQREAIQHDINKEIDQLQQALEQRRAQLIGTLDQLTQHKLKSLATQRGQVELLQVKLTSCLNYTQGGLTTGTEGEVLAMKAPVLKRIQQITADFNTAEIQPEEEANLYLNADNKQDLQRACSQFAEVKDSQQISQANSYARGDALQTVTAGEQAMVTVYAVSGRKIEYNKEIDLTAELVHCNSKATKQCTVQKQGTTNQHIVTYQPTNRGKHQLHIKINGREIQGSPYTIAVTPSPQGLGKPVRIIRNLIRPRCVTTNSKNQLIVTEAGAQCVSVFSPEGEKIHSFGSKDSQQGQLNSPVGVTVDNHDNIYVVDNINNRIQKFTSTGKFITSVGTQGRGKLQFSYPWGIYFNPNNGRLYVCDQLNHRVQILNQDLSFHNSFGKQGIENGNFIHPMHIAINSKGEVYVTDYNKNCVQVFNEEGKFLQSFSNKGQGQNPVGIAIDSCGTVYVSEEDRHCISVFNAQGKYLTTFGGKGKEGGKFNNTSGLHINNDDILIVGDTDNGRIQML